MHNYRTRTVIIRCDFIGDDGGDPREAVKSRARNVAEVDGQLFTAVEVAHRLDCRVEIVLRDARNDPAAGIFIAMAESSPKILDALPRRFSKVVRHLPKSSYRESFII